MLNMKTKIHAFGSNGSGQLAIGHQEDTSTPQPVRLQANTSLSLIEVKQIACGGNHTIVLFEDGKIATAGDNEDGRCISSTLGLRSSLIEVYPLEIGVENITHVAATWNATIFTNGKKVFTCGSGDTGELGLGPEITIAKHPTQITDFPPAGTAVQKLASCMGHVTAVLSNGEVWGWGKGRKGQLGGSFENRWKPSKVEGISFFVVDAVCGKDFSCVFGDPSKGELLTLGPTGNDRFGIRSKAPAVIPEWKQVGASWGSIFVLSESGHLTSWGRDDHGQLPPSDLPILRTFAAGSEHCLGVTETGNVLAWGWGEHGNCGSPTDSNGDVKGQCNGVETPPARSTVFAGCATSFIVTNGTPQLQPETDGQVG